MWVYFNVPEARYLEDMASQGQHMVSRNIELVLANGKKFPQTCESIRREAKFNNETGNLAYRADFPNPDGLLRHGQTGTILIHRPLKEAIVIPQRATFEILDKRYVYVVDTDNVVHQREITILHEMDDIFVINRVETKKVESKKVESKKEGPKTEEHKAEGPKTGGHKAEGPKTEEYKNGLDVNDRIVLEGVRQVHDGEKLTEFEFRKPEEALANQKLHAE
jgi:membrane fusion protein (multidrug efflux system)